jgi:hypothetical protein
VPYASDENVAFGEDDVAENICASAEFCGPFPKFSMGNTYVRIFGDLIGGIFDDRGGASGCGRAGWREEVIEAGYVLQSIRMPA